jgi:hypothetical protein
MWTSKFVDGALIVMMLAKVTSEIVLPVTERKTCSLALAIP